MKPGTGWRFTPDEFAWVWQAETGREYPYPISILESAPDLDAYLRQRQAISERYAPGSDPALTRALQTFADSEIRIVCTGQIHATKERIRCAAVAYGDYGVVLHQLPGSTTEFGGDLEIIVTERDLLGRGIVAALPRTGEGLLPRMVAYTPRVRGEEPPTTYFVQADGHEATETRIRALLRAPRTAEGHLSIERNVRDGRGYPPQYINWLDVENSHRAAGRYLIEVDNDTVVSPASEAYMASELTRHAQLRQ